LVSVLFSAKKVPTPIIRRILADSTGVFIAHVPAMVQEELEQRQIVLPQLPPQEEVASQVRKRCRSRIKTEQALRRIAIQQARLDPLA
jgi:hypothetical protein